MYAVVRIASPLTSSNAIAPVTPVVETFQSSEQNLTDNGGDSNIAAGSAMGYDAYFVALEVDIVKCDCAGHAGGRNLPKCLGDLCSVGRAGSLECLECDEVCVVTHCRNCCDVAVAAVVGQVLLAAFKECFEALIKGLVTAFPMR